MSNWRKWEKTRGYYIRFKAHNQWELYYNDRHIYTAKTEKGAKIVQEKHRLKKALDALELKRIERMEFET